MPIYKVMSPQPVVNAKFKVVEVSTSVSAAHDHNGQDARPEHEGHAGQGQNVKDASKGHDSSSPEAQHESVKTKTFDHMETVVEREVREQLRREAELAVQNGLLSRKSLSSPKDSTPTKVDILVTSSSEQNGRRHEHRAHVVPDHVIVVERTVVVSRSPETYCTTTTTNTDGGSLKTSKEVRSGANRILQELQQQAVREEECWNQWKETGLNREDGKLEQPWPGNKSYPKVGMNMDLVDSGNVGLEERLPNLPDVLVEPPDGEIAQRDGTSSGGQSSKSLIGQRRHSSKVQPFEDVELIKSEIQFPYVPQNETPIDREIRIQLEREEALCLARGVRFSASHSPEVEVEVMKPRLVEEGCSSTLSSSSLGMSMKRFSEGRLRNELERERKREIDLLKEGKIKVLSEQRMPEAVCYVELISSDKEELRDLSRRRRSMEKMASKELASTKMASTETTPKQMASKSQIHVEVRTDQVDEGKNRLNTKLDGTSPSPKSEKHVESAGRKERVGKSYKPNAISPNSYTTDDVRKILLTVAEQRIEEEIAENKKRELELRKQRRHQLNSELPRQPEQTDGSVNNAHAPDYASQNEAYQSSDQPIEDGDRCRDDAAEVHMTVSLDSVDCGDEGHQQPPDGQGGSRREPRRLALIDHWERGIIQTGDHSVP